MFLLLVLCPCPVQMRRDHQGRPCCLDLDLALGCHPVRALLPQNSPVFLRSHHVHLLRVRALCHHAVVRLQELGRFLGHPLKPWRGIVGAVRGASLEESQRIRQ